ncbi:SAM-dependent methyltransferase [Novosphingobium sp.]|uniref:class I SAM-dependent methyltransferase n=1 Tax=Novosphingobium sp. TaxID=1874826 RepID=UPI00286C9383|nr:SAM-dependent methyltransferase [Novosphingobium sp.]
MSATGTSDPLGEIFRRLIGNTGPISLMHYMGEANARYYASRDPLGAAGDFVTAPEISQMFGELIGLWLADMWINAGREEPVHYVEMGPGRGTLARDALRAAKRYGLTPSVHFVEASTALKDVQLASVPQAQWHHDLSTIPPYGPVLVVANEFLDALPVRQLVMTEAGWRERMVVPEGDRFVCIAGSQPMDAAIPEARRAAEVGTIIETCPGAAATIYEIAGRLKDQGGAALFIDYGHEQLRDGSTLQAVRQHLKVDPFIQPGEADLTAHVDFATLAPIAQSRGVRWLGTVPQGRWLRNLGIDARAQTLAQAAPQHGPAIEAAKERLVGEGQMGLLFKVMGLAAPSWPGGAGF